MGLMGLRGSYLVRMARSSGYEAPKEEEIRRKVLAGQDLEEQSWCPGLRPGLPSTALPTQRPRPRLLHHRRSGQCGELYSYSWEAGARLAPMPPKAREPGNGVW